LSIWYLVFGITYQIPNTKYSGSNTTNGKLNHGQR
jgi:hypothetical protein